MKKLKQTHKIIFVLLLMSLFSFKAQQVQTTNEDTLIVGTWVAEGNPTSYYSVYESNGIVKRYTDNTLSKTYNWSIVQSTTPSGLTIPYLKLINVNDSTDVYDYEINALNDEILVLVYQRGEGRGIAKPATYLR